MIFSMLWMTKRQRWRRGPNWPEKLAHPTRFCSCALNSSSVVFIQHHFIDLRPTFNVIFDYDHNKWIEIPSMDDKIFAHNPSMPYSCAAAVLFEKNTSQKLMVLKGYFGKYQTLLLFYLVHTTILN